MSKVLVIGLDGATWNFIKPWAESGDLPTFRKLMENGCYGILKSTIPPVTVPAWPAFFTGKNPGKFGVFDFMKKSKKDYIGRVVSLKDIKSKKLWNYLNFHGKKAIILNMPLAYPPEKIDGVLVSGLLTPDGTEYAYPKEIQKELEKMNYFIEIDPEKIVVMNNEEEFLEELKNMIKMREKCVLYLMKNYDWDLFFVLFRAPDIIQHKMYGKKEKIKIIYEELDKAIGHIIKQVREDTTVMLMSDHGFTYIKKLFYINEWLRQLGLVEYKKVNYDEIIKTKPWIKLDRKNKLERILYSLGLNRARLSKFLDKFKLSWIKKKIPEKLKSKFPDTNLDFDWNKTKAYFGGTVTQNTQAIIINCKGREPNGIVDPKEYEKIRELIIEKLKELRDPETGEKIVREIYKREEIYSGPYVKDAPDILFLTKDGYEVSAIKINSNLIFQKTKGTEGQHHIDGIFLAYGPGIKKSYEIKEAHIYDLLPTILHIFNIPIPNDVDGKVLIEIFEKNSECAKRKPKYVDRSYYDKKEDERERLKNKVRELRLKGKIYFL